MIETLLRREYLVRTGPHLLPTAMGLGLIAALPVASLASPELTGGWEARLSRIARGQESRAAFMADIASYVASMVDAIRAAAPPAVDPAARAAGSFSRGRPGGRAGKRRRGQVATKQRASGAARTRPRKAAAGRKARAPRSRPASVVGASGGSTAAPGKRRRGAVAAAVAPAVAVAAGSGAAAPARRARASAGARRPARSSVEAPARVSAASAASAASALSALRGSRSTAPAPGAAGSRLVHVPPSAATARSPEAEALASAAAEAALARPVARAAQEARGPARPARGPARLAQSAETARAERGDGAGGGDGAAGAERGLSRGPGRGIGRGSRAGAPRACSGWARVGRRGRVVARLSALWTRHPDVRAARLGLFPLATRLRLRRVVRHRRAPPEPGAATRSDPARQDAQGPVHRRRWPAHRGPLDPAPRRARCGGPAGVCLS
ncbi:MAG: hypothetical protein IPI49_29995 [Myxococcales bacterium]|nr:hypothetical protein [Myxococcales bacterium]